MDICIQPQQLGGAVTPPPSKSLLHRLILCAGLADGVSTIENAAHSQDIDATLRCLTALGGQWTEPRPHVFQITGIGGIPRAKELPLFDCGESGSTLRFFLPVALAVCGGGIFTGRGRLMERPLEPYFDLFHKKGISVQQTDGTLTVRGVLTPGDYVLPGNVSSQFFSGLLLALPLLEGESVLRAATPLESADYVSMTREALRIACIPTGELPGQSCFQVFPAGFQPFSVPAEADWSQAAFWIAAAFPGRRSLQIRGLNPGSSQGDKRVADLAQKLANSGDRTVDLSPCPDLLPPLAVMAAVRQGTTQFVNAARLRLKESDRLASTAALIAALGGSVRMSSDTLEISGGALRGGVVDGFHDHRIVMAAAAAAPHCTQPVTIRGAEAVEKSYPSFWDDYKRLGGNFDVL
jgi:3-phosphoshikimate 1-carboxyvinyltransferase